MLEFDQTFLAPEIRDGFFVDATMKSMWAADMEVVARISQICEKYNIQWYAAYGTLLGAIRHEGYIPWDDDMDIWVMRQGYNKLMEVLPKELPEGYVVQSAMTDVGYDQFHTCVNNGSGISIRKEWLEEYHGCPFTVAVDIFPLDYLPRNDGEEEIQRKLIEMIGRAALLAKNLGHEKYQGTEKEAAVTEIMEAKKYLEEFCSYRFDQKNFDEEQWSKISSEFWKCGNYVAMIYNEEDADYIVEYVDYAKWHKKFKKEWFEEAYSATFENVMLPVPCGYDEILRTIYGEYTVPVKHWDGHEYPFYARQLRELRRIVKEKEKAADPDGTQQKDEPQKVFPTGWEQLLAGKKVVLFEDGIPAYTEYENKALDKLEEVLNTFKENKDSVTLWWRPQHQIRTALGLVSEDLLKRYDEIIHKYLEEAWGIYDISLDEEMAIEKADAYYGEHNATVNRIKGKMPIMIEAIL